MTRVGTTHARTLARPTGGLRETFSTPRFTPSPKALYYYDIVQYSAGGGGTVWELRVGLYSTWPRRCVRRVCSYLHSSPVCWRRTV